jgi:tRNA modification GTPase
MNDPLPPPTDTIAAVATPPGRGGIGVVRVSGPLTATLAVQILGFQPRPRHAHYSHFHGTNDDILDQGVALYFPAPHSFTGEDVLELQGHGGPVVLDALLQFLLSQGCRLARPGEFSERAFLNGKLDLAQAEAVADLIDASSTAAARSALRSLQGEFSARIHNLVETVTDLRVFVEAAIDFPEEEIDFLDDRRISDRLDALLGQLASLLETARQGCLLREGMTIALAGRPNAGKSSLLNALTRSEAAIVSATPGTTRDVLRHEIQIDGLPVHVIDTAGLRDSADEIESEGVRRALAAISTADRVLLLVDDNDAPEEAIATLRQQMPSQAPLTIVRNKIDLSDRAPGLKQSDSDIEVALSAKTGRGLPELRAHLETCVGFVPAGEGSYTARRRHLDAIERARSHIENGAGELTRRGAAELLAEELRLAQLALGEITGDVTSDELLGRIFASFCIGK